MPLVFLYGTSLPQGPDHAWVADLPAQPAAVHGTLWRGPRNRPALVPDPEGRPIRGLLVDIDPGRLRVLDTMETAGGAPLRLEPVRAALHMRSVEAVAWVLTLPHPERAGYRRVRATEWTQVAP